MRKKIFLCVLLLLFSFFIVSCDKIGIEDPIYIIEKDDSAPTGVSVTGDYKVEIGKTIKLNAIVLPEDKALQNVTWSSSDENIAIVSQHGVVTGINSGKAIIKATSEYKLIKVEGSIEIEVFKLPSSISFEIDDLYVDEEVYLNPIFDSEDVRGYVSYSSSNEEVIDIDNDGFLKALSCGSADITIKSVSDSNVSITKTVNVLKREGNPTALKVTSARQVGTKDTLEIIVETTPRNALNDFVITTSRDNVVKIEGNKVTGLNMGSVALTIASKYDSNVSTTIDFEVVAGYLPDEYESSENKFIHIIESSKSSVVGVSNYQLVDNKLTLSSIGSGAIYKAIYKMKDGRVFNDVKKVSLLEDVETIGYYVITNRHVVLNNKEIKIYIPKIDEEINAKLIQYDEKVDLAVCYFEYNKYIRPLSFADSDDIRQGEYVIAIGNPDGYEFHSSATHGIISYPKRYISDDTDNDKVNDWDSEYIQHDAPINPGNSGGPLFNMKGEIVGINTLKLSATNIEGMGFSIPSNVVKDLLPFLEKGERPVRARIGVTVISIKDIIKGGLTDTYLVPEDVKAGLYVSAVSEDSVAKRGGILKDDILLKFNGEAVYDSIVLRAELGKIIVGASEEIEVEVYRNGSIIKLTLIF